MEVNNLITLVKHMRDKMQIRSVGYFVRYIILFVKVLKVYFTFYTKLTVPALLSAVVVVVPLQQ